MQDSRTKYVPRSCGLHPATDFFGGSSAAPLLGPSGTNNRSWTRALRLKKARDPTDDIDSEPTSCLNPPARPQIGCLWRKHTPTQSPCPTTSRHSVIPARNNRRTWCRDQVDPRRSARFFVKEIDWQARIGYRYTEGGSNQTAQRCRCGGGRIVIFLANLRRSACR